MVQPLHIKNAHIWDGKTTVQRDLYTTDVVVDQPANGAQVVDLDGYTIFPGLINAHDHLELNHYPRSKFRDKYDNAHQWGEDMNARLDTEPYKSLRAYPLWNKLFIGGLKNLLCGATTVAHHNPPHKELWHKDFPVRVLRKYDWTHSLHFSTDAEIVESYRKTPKDVPWFIHLAEGTDDVAASEYDRLDNLGCISQNKTVLIHCVGMRKDNHHIIAPHARGVVWCPSTNLYLLGKTLIDDGTPYNPEVNSLALGSDSRLTADGDLLDELRLAFSCYHNKSDYAYVLTQLVFYDAGFLIHHISKRDWLRAQPYADLVVLPKSANDAEKLCTSRRADLALVVKGGVPQIGDPDVMAKFPNIQTVAAKLDGKPKRIQVDLARRIHQNKLKEPGLELDEMPKRKFMLW
jgi:cytosine/adenosine deaminase-related metal-dependent hydrolase